MRLEQSQRNQGQLMINLGNKETFKRSITEECNRKSRNLIMILAN